MEEIGAIILIASLGPIIGTLMGTIIKPNNKFLCGSFSFAAGVMIAVAFLELIPSGEELLSVYSLAIAFLIGFWLMYIADQLIPHFHSVSDSKEESFDKTSITVFIGVMMHNFPEGFAIGAGFLHSPELGLIIATAIALHDIPETIVPVSSRFFVKENRLTAILTGIGILMSTLLGIFLGYLFLGQVSPVFTGVAIVVAAGVMVYLAGDELLPTALDFGYKHLVNHSFVLGIVFMLVIELALH